ncbi:5-formyltetrahydrofolate cyclo-ligase [Kribbella amoyensis]|uniref:5-formyltetrahydrofolate cyclo-ligase n=1 Tax=Kribbella amoyensis TaxID=996641 RepID=A0A561BJP8_9ACTN|nr:5-formyltetrahydrofolate cyclo-ligase [Kribbella amoyensis]
MLDAARTTTEIRQADRIALYVALGPEPQTGALIDWLLAEGKEVLLPILYADNDLGWGLAPGAADLVPGRLGLTEPPIDLGESAIGTADLVICPAVAVDRTGVRLGRGGGSYDRALARVPAGVPIWAAVYDNEVLDSVPADPHDQLVHAALTPTRLIRLRSSG